MDSKAPNCRASLSILAINNAWATFGYFGTQTILVLYFIHIFHLDRHTSYLLYGAYATVTYAMPILGGIIADNFFGNKQTILMGFIFNLFGNILLVSLNRYCFCLGLAASLIGAGLCKSNLIHLVGTLYPTNAAKKERSFTWIYLAINIGGTLGPLVYGLIAYFSQWNFVFLFGAVGILFGAILFLSKWSDWNEGIKKVQLNKTMNCAIYIGLASVLLLLSFTFYKPELISPVIISILGFSIFYLIFSIRKYKGREKNHLIALFILSFFGMFYFAASLQIGATLTLFLQQKIQQGLIPIKLPASVFSALYCFFVLILAPFFTYLWKYIKITTPIKLAIGVALAALGIGSFAFSAHYSFILSGVLIGNFLLSAGELVITPAMYTLISDKAPEAMKSSMISCWLLFIAFGGYLSSLLASVSHFVVSKVAFAQVNYFGEFTFIAAFTFFVSVVVFITAPALTRLLK